MAEPRDPTGSETNLTPRIPDAELPEYIRAASTLINTLDKNIQELSYLAQWKGQPVVNQEEVPEQKAKRQASSARLTLLSQLSMWLLGQTDLATIAVCSPDESDPKKDRTLYVSENSETGRNVKFQSVLPSDENQYPDRVYNDDWMLHLAYSKQATFGGKKGVPGSTSAIFNARFLPRFQRLLDQLSDTITEARKSSKSDDAARESVMLHVEAIEKLVIAACSTKIKAQLDRDFLIGPKGKGSIKFHQLFPEDLDSLKQYGIEKADLEALNTQKISEKPEMVKQLNNLKGRSEGHMFKLFAYDPAFRLDQNKSDTSRSVSTWVYQLDATFPARLEERMDPINFHQCMGRAFNSLRKALGHLEVLMSLGSTNLKGKPLPTEYLEYMNNKAQGPGALRPGDFLNITMRADEATALERQHAIDSCLHAIIQRLNLLDKIAMFSPTWYYHVNGTAFRNIIAKLRATANGGDLTPKLSDEILDQGLYPHDPFGVWLRLTTRWVHLFQKLSAKDAEARKSAWNDFARKTTIVKVTPPPAAAISEQMTIQQVLSPAGYEGISLTRIWGAWEKVITMLKLKDTWKTKIPPRVHCECTLSLLLGCVDKPNEVTAFGDQPFDTASLDILTRGPCGEIGVTRKCCVLCSIWISAFNQALQQAKGSTVSRVMKGQCAVTLANSHGRIFSWSPPHLDNVSKAAAGASIQANRKVWEELCKGIRAIGDLDMPGGRSLVGHPDTGTSGDEHPFEPELDEPSTFS